MARDETLLERVSDGNSLPTLRLYQWETPTISLGYFQRYAEYQALASPAGDLAVVRRLTGGGAILHDLELTYSLSLPHAHPLASRGPHRLYELAHDAIIACMADRQRGAARGGETDDSSPRRGPFFCFERRHRFDVLVGADKIAGSAQRRTRTATLQHGSIVIANRFTQHPTATILEGSFEGNSEHILMTDYVACVHELRHAFVQHFSKLTEVEFDTGDWDTDELAATDSLIAKYAGVEWTRRS